MKFTTTAAILAATATTATADIFGTNSSAFSGFGDGCGKCKPFTINLARGPSDGSKMFSRDAILVNGTIPGPPLNLVVGDCVDFTVHNNMPDSTGIHFHGIRQLATPWSDGTPGLSQSAVKSGETYTYRWEADEAGVYFYHAHYKSQMMDGAYGAIVISDKPGTAKTYSALGDIAALEAAEAKIETVLASDWNQFTADRFFDIQKQANIDDACTDSIILNGQGSIYCYDNATLKANQRVQVPIILGNSSSLTAKGCIPASNPLLQGNYSRTLSALPAGAYDQCVPYVGSNYTYKVDPANQWAAMSFISPSGFTSLVVSIDSHKMYVFELNGGYITPQTVDQIKVTPGDRVSFFVKLDQTPADYTIRVANDGINQVISGFGKLSYQGGVGAASVPASINLGGTAPPNTTVVLLDGLNSKPFSAPVVGQTADKTFNLGILKNPGAKESWQWVLNGLAPYGQDNDDGTPMLYQGPANAPVSNLVLRTNYNDWVDLIITIAGPLAQPHPIHKHANKFFVIGSGVGAFNYTSVKQAQDAGVKFNTVNPPYLDGFTNSPAQGNSAWMVFRYQANTPGAWFMHCHIQTHFSGGMAVAILDGVDKWPALPSNPGDVCKSNRTTTTTAATTTATATTSRVGSTTGTTTGVVTTTGAVSGTTTKSGEATTTKSGEAGTTTKSGEATTSSSSQYGPRSSTTGADGVSTTSVYGPSSSWTWGGSSSSWSYSSTGPVGVSTTGKWESSTSKTSGGNKPATTSSSTSRAGGLGGWGDWTQPAPGQATNVPNAGPGNGRPGQGSDGAFNWASWSSVISAANAASASQGCAKTVLAGSGQEVNGWGIPFGPSNSDIWNNWNNPATATAADPKKTKTATVTATATNTWGSWGNANGNGNGNGNGNNNANTATTWATWNGASSSSVKATGVAAASSSWATWASAAKGSATGVDPANVGIWATWTTSATAVKATGVDATSAATWSSWGSAGASPTGVASYGGNGNGAQGVAAYTGAATTIKAGGALFGAMVLTVAALLL